MPIKGGYYIKARCIQESWIAHSAPIDREVWDYLLREANHRETKKNGFIILRGQLFRTYREIREALGWKVGFRTEYYGESAMKHCMKRLMNARMIELVKEPRGNLITVCKYDHYQNPKNYEGTGEGTINEPVKEPSMNRQGAAINKNGKNLKKEKRNNPPIVPHEEIKKEFRERFDKFISIYPNAVDKSEAWEAWQQLFLKGYAKKRAVTKFLCPLTEDLFQRIIKAVKNQTEERAWKAASVPPIWKASWKNPATWLRKKCWTDKTDHNPEQIDNPNIVL